MKVTDVTATLEDALASSGCDAATVVHKPRLLSPSRRLQANAYQATDNGSSCISGDLAKWLDAKDMDHVRGAPNHPQTQGKIERWHQTIKNRILLENYYLPGALAQAIGVFIDHYDHARRHESLGNVTPADAYFGRAPAILEERRRIKDETLKQRSLLNQRQAA